MTQNLSDVGQCGTAHREIAGRGMPEEHLTRAASIFSCSSPIARVQT